MTVTQMRIDGETPQRRFTPAALGELLTDLEKVGLQLPPSTEVFRWWQRDEGTIQAELRDTAAPGGILELSREELIEHARVRTNERASLFAALAHLGPGSGAAVASAAHFAVEEELAAALRAELYSAADTILDHLRPKFEPLAKAVWETVKLGITPGMSAGQALDLPGDAARIRAAWQAGGHNMATLAALIDLRVQLSQIIGLPGGMRFEDGTLSWWPAFGTRPLAWGVAPERRQVLPPDATNIHIYAPRVETAGQKAHRLTIEAGGPLKLLPVAATQSILEEVGIDA